MKKHALRTLWGSSVLLLCVAALAVEPTKESLSAVKKNIDQGKAVLLDVRERSEWDAGHVQGAISVPLSELKAGGKVTQIDKLPKSKIIYTHCVAGKRALESGKILEKLGFDVRPLSAGYDDLLRAGFPKGD